MYVTIRHENPVFSIPATSQSVKKAYQRDSSTCPCDCSEWSRAMECAPPYVAGALLRGDQRRRGLSQRGTSLETHIRVEDPRIPTLGIGGYDFRKALL